MTTSSVAVTRGTVQQLLIAAGLPPVRDDGIDIAPGEIAYPSRVRCAEVAAAALAAGGVAAGAIWQLRTGQPQTVHVALREAAASLASYAHLQFMDASRDPGMGPRSGPNPPAASGFFATLDRRFVYLHPSFAPNHDRILQLLEVPNDHAAIAAAVATCTAQTLEDKLRARGLTAAIALAPHEWDASPAGRELAARPVVEIIRIGDSAPEPFRQGVAVRGAAAGDGPLSGVRVLDLTRVLAGPTCARTLAHYGAQVLHIANAQLPTVPRFTVDTGHGKRNANLDLKQPADLAVLRDLLRTADVFSQGYRSGAMERLGLGVADLARLRPGIVCTSINCYGHEGPLRDQPGWEQLAQTATGLAWLHGGAAAPQLQPCALTDYSTGYLAAFGTLVALLKRARYGGSYLVRVALCRTAVFARSLGLHDAADVAGRMPFTPAEIASWQATSHGPYGELRHLRPAVQLSVTPTGWSLPAAPLSSHAPAWE